jgi:hypothetical protein
MQAVDRRALFIEANPMRGLAQAARCGRVAKALSFERLAPYQHPGEALYEALARYAWNVALCEAFYPSLNTIEVTLRNNMDAAISGAYPARGYDHIPSWLDAQPAILGPHARNSVHDAKKKILPCDPRSGAFLATTRRVAPGKLVAELSFGFWSGLLHKEYLYQSAKDRRFWPHLLKSVFPAAPGNARVLRDFGGPVNEIRKFRNRVFHHEPIWNRPNLSADHALIMRILGWLNPEAAALVASLDRVAAVLTNDTRRRIRYAVYRVTR